MKIRELVESRKTSRDEKGMQTTRYFEAYNDNPEFVLQNLKEPMNDDEREGLYDPTGNKIEFLSPLPDIAGLYCKSVSVEPLDNVGCRVTVVYGPQDFDQRADLDGTIWDYDFSSQNTHITSTTYGQTHAPAWADCGPVIGADGEDVNGIDVYRPAASLKIIKKYNTYPSQSERQQWTRIVASVNDNSFAGYSAREVLFLGFKIDTQQVYRDFVGRPTGLGVWFVEFNFLIAKTQPVQAVQLLDGSTVYVQPYPFDYIWFTHAGKIKDSDSGDGSGSTKKVRQNGIVSIHIAKVYPTGSFSLLPINPSGPRYYSYA